MFKTASMTAKGVDTRARIYEAALALFRQRGFDATTMRDVAAAAGMSLGAAYHYFPSKDAIVLAYYEHVSTEHARTVATAIPDLPSLADRLKLAVTAKLDILRKDRALMGALLRYAGDPQHPLSFFGEGTRHHRLESMAVFADALGDQNLPPDLQRLAPLGLWALHMGILLFFIYDSSPAQRRTAALADGAVELFVAALKLTRLPVLRSVRRRVFGLLDEVRLVPTVEDIQSARAS